nr:hypothetical protein [Tanacetum cinerariifolium]
MKMCDEDAR